MTFVQDLICFRMFCIETDGKSQVDTLLCEL